MSYLRLEHLTKKFGEFTALEDINLTAGAGAFVVLLGPSGCGKSTLLRLITGLTEDHDGEIHINDRRVTDLDPKDRKVAMVFQSYALYPHLTVARNISFGMEINRVPKAEREAKVLEAARALQLDTLLDRYPSELSGGQRQRVAIGRCLVREPDLFLFDEPLSNLDAKLRHETRVELKQLHQRLQTTTVYVTHDQHEAMTLATQVVLMDKGRIVQTASPVELYENPVNRFAATFIGTPQINLFKGEVRPHGQNIRFTADGISLDLPQSVLRGGIDGVRQVELGIRAENANVTEGKNPNLLLGVDYIEQTGSDVFIYGAAGGQSACFRVHRRTSFDSGSQVPLTLDAEAAMLFDLTSGERI
jgi:multiple sugar transport system ATP-binding protein